MRCFSGEKPQTWKYALACAPHQSAWLGQHNRQFEDKSRQWFVVFFCCKVFFSSVQHVSGTGWGGWEVCTTESIEDLLTSTSRVGVLNQPD